MGPGGHFRGNVPYRKITQWKKLPPRFPVKTVHVLPTELPVPGKIPRVQASEKTEESAASRKTRLARRDAVRESFLHSWAGYKKHAWMHDEVRPLTGESVDPFGGWAATLVDALDTLWIMGLRDEFEEAVKACEEIDFTKTRAELVNIFETVIRYLGGFLAAYELSGKKYPVLLRKAVQVADLVMCAFDTPTHLPVARWDWRQYTGGMDQGASARTLVAEVGSLSLELTKLTQLTGDQQYYDAVKRISDQFEKSQQHTSLPGMWPVYVDPSTWPMGFKSHDYTLGGMSDSLYEYFPKQYLLLGGVLEQPRKLYEGFIDVAMKHLLKRGANPQNVPVAFFVDGRISGAGTWKAEITTNNHAQHLTCFTGGMVGLAAKVFSRPHDLEAAAQLTNGCVWAYNTTATGLGPEAFAFVPCDDDCQWTEKRWVDALWKQWRTARYNQGEAPKIDELQTFLDEAHFPKGMVNVNDHRYILRPEAIESVFIMHRITGEQEWAEKAWDMFKAVETATRTDIAAASVEDVLVDPPLQKDSMESFWLAETLKYFYLVFEEHSVVSLDEWVLNTEAHPLRRADAPEAS
ncbi:class I alpha-mannosidase [Microdochium trichocladiopsis]|uniref:alpha-1,2-Mannosidase n=1 Tax=Microdochium trichocladiopsis TaxID=1682393 RepID=A0A9P8YAJ6_9PEZI|nr:class I alpha-mannosidase [Microdochium trichocladiopsis]KAH7032819.1 class I alpha-mannosidase [Microdochium trichocladiopsis]